MCIITTWYRKFAKAAVPYSNKKCEDQFIGIIELTKNQFKWKQTSLMPYMTQKTVKTYSNQREQLDKLLRTQDIPTIIIVLESPHVDEYKTVYPMPAVGETGKLFHSEFPNSFLNWYTNSSIQLEKEYKILFLNPIQYQTSLGAQTSYYRDEIFNKLWKKKTIQKDFENRLRNAKPSIIINCCTSPFRRKIQKNIDVVAGKALLLHAYHPSYWRKNSEIFSGGWKK